MGMNRLRLRIVNVNEPAELSEKCVLQTERFRVVEIDQSLPEGGIRRRHAIRHPGSVVILPLIDENHVCLIRNFRVSVAQWLLELPAGTLEPNEPPLECAKRELVEETGYRSNHLRPLGRFYAAPGILDEFMHLFVADQLSEGDPEREPGELIQNVVLTWDEVTKLLAAGEIVDAKTIIGLQTYLLQHGRGQL